MKQKEICKHATEFGQEMEIMNNQNNQYSQNNNDRQHQSDRQHNQENSRQNNQYRSEFSQENQFQQNNNDRQHQSDRFIRFQLRSAFRPDLNLPRFVQLHFKVFCFRPDQFNRRQKLRSAFSDFVSVTSDSVPGCPF